ncbi:MAG: FtsX-like permease family protein [Actinomycetota bacterium]|nr:FtsX-like permease family protein [Actinomycetota bacterium]
MTLTQARAVARLARRSAWRHPWRTALIAALIGMAVMIAVFVAIAMRTFTPSEEEQFAADFGASDLRIELFGYSAEAAGWITAELEGATFVVVDRIHHPQVEIVGTDLGSPLVEGMFEVFEGDVPGPGEVAVSWEVARRGEFSVGDPYDVPGFDTPLTITAIVLPPLNSSGRQIVLTPGDLAVVTADGEATDVEYFRRATWLIDTDDPASFASHIEQEWNSAVHTFPFPSMAASGPFMPRNSNISVADRQQRAQWGVPGGRDLTQSASAVSSLIAAVLLAQIALLAGAAYASGIRRRLREIGLIATQGATTGQIRAFVVGEAVVTGAIGAVIGATLALGVAHGVQPFVQRLWDPRITHIEVEIADVLGPILLAVIAATIAAWLPARTASRVPVLVALQGRMPTGRTPKWIAPVSLGAASAGVLLIIVARDAHSTAATVQSTLGALLVIGGGALLSVPLVGAAGRLADRLPVLGRLVARDAARQTIRAASAITVLMVILTGTIAIGVAMRTSEASAFTTYGGGLGDPRVVFASGGIVDDGADPLRPGYTPEFDLRQHQAAEIARVIPDASIFNVATLPGRAVLAEFTGYAMLGGAGGFVYCLDGSYAYGCVAADSVDLHPVMAEPSLLDALGIEGARSELASGNPIVLGNRHARIEIAYGTDIVTAEMFPASVGGWRSPRLIVPESWALERALLDESYRAAFFVNDVPLTEEEREAINVQEITVSIGSDGQFGLTDTQTLAIILAIALATMFVVIGIVTALSTTESDRDISVMVAVGAAPSLRRRFLGSQTAFYTASAAVLAIPIGLLLMRVASGDDVRWGPLGVWTGGIAVPWTMAFLVLALLPIVVGIGTALVVRSLPAHPPRRLG